MKKKNVPTKNTKKLMQENITQLSNAMGAVFNHISEVRNHLVGLETLVMHLADFLEKKDKFEEFLEVKIKERKEAQTKIEELKSVKEYKGQKDDTYR